MCRIPGALSAQGVAWFHEQLDTADWIDDHATTGAQEAQIKNSRQVNTQSERYGVLQQAIQTVVNNSALFFAVALPKALSTPLFNRYQDNETCDSRADGVVCNHPQNGWMRTDLSVTLFLSNPNDYEGGELLVNDICGQHTVKFPAGDLAFYPSSSLHYVTPVTHGAHVASSIWVQSIVRDDENRAILPELDKDIQPLKARHREGCETLLLLNLYHNLLREWSGI